MSKRDKRYRIQAPDRTYFIYSPALEAVKIGISWNPEGRMRQIAVANPDDLALLYVKDGDHEEEFHKLFAEYRIRGEWFTASPVLEWLRCNPVTPVTRTPEEIQALVNRAFS